MSHSLTPQDGYDALLKRIKSSEPVVAVFDMTNMHATVMRIEVDGERAPFYFSLNRDGTWSATSTLDL